MKESKFKKQFQSKLEERTKGIDLDFFNWQGSRSRPDMIILGTNVWATLEFKRSKNASAQPNQDYHIDRLAKKGYARFVYPENEEEVLDDLEELFTS